jgi:hypothetical protein
MHGIDDRLSGLKRSAREAIEISLWEIYLLRNRNNLTTRWEDMLWIEGRSRMGVLMVKG